MSFTKHIKLIDLDVLVSSGARIIVSSPKEILEMIQEAQKKTYGA